MGGKALLSNGKKQCICLPCLICATSIVIEQFSEPHDACVGYDNGGSLTVGAFLSNLQVSAPSITLEVQVEQL